MATLAKRMRGGSLMFEIQWYAGKKRRTIPLGKKFTEKTASELLEVVESLLYCQVNGIERLGKKTLNWIETASPELREKLAKAGLVEIPEQRTLEAAWQAFLDQQEGIKDSTRETYATAIKRTKTMLKWCVKQGWLEKDPLVGIGCGSYVNPETEQEVPMDEYRRLLDACPCQEWRTILALVRIGGLRSPSEVMRLRWSDVLWDGVNGKGPRFYVRSSKTEHHRGKEGRWVPIFPGLREELEVLYFREESEGREFVINRYPRREKTNLGTQFDRMCLRVGITPFARPFDNMRASRSTEVFNEFGPKAESESEWIGHSSKIALQHYARVREEDFERAAGESVSVQQEKTTEKILPAIFPAASSGIDRQGAASKK